MGSGTVCLLFKQGHYDILYLKEKGTILLARVDEPVVFWSQSRLCGAHTDCSLCFAFLCWQGGWIDTAAWPLLLARTKESPSLSPTEITEFLTPSKVTFPGTTSITSTPRILSRASSSTGATWRWKRAGNRRPFGEKLPDGSQPR